MGWRLTQLDPVARHVTTTFTRPSNAPPRTAEAVELVACSCRICAPESWSERRDLNSGPPVPQTGALTGLRYAPPVTRTSTMTRQGAQGRRNQAATGLAGSGFAAPAAPGGTAR